MVGWLTFNMIALSLFSNYGYLSSISICIFSSFHFRKQSCQLKQEEKSKQHIVLSCTHTQMPRQSVGRTPEWEGSRGIWFP